MTSPHITSPVSTAPASRATAREARSYIVDDCVAGSLIVRRGARVGIHLTAGEDPAVTRAVADLAGDLEKVAGAHPELIAEAAGARIVVGTIGTSPVIDEAIADGRLNVSELRDEDGALRWEGFLVALVDDVVYLVGTDRRGTIYAIYDFTETIGVSPWYWWGDVPIQQREHITIAADTHVADWPSVRYRGVFLNDEEELYHWARMHTADDTIGPEAYARIFELLLRLKGNYLWAAMHVGAFNDDVENGRLAQEMGVVIGTQHCDMLLRSNEHEFRPWAAQHGVDVEYDYSLPGRNRELLQDYWRGSVQQNRDYDVTWTVGMRGVHDSGFVTTAIDENPDLTDAEKVTARVRLLETVIEDQRALLSKELNAPASDIPQLFIPYKEVLPLYDAGLEIPDDITMVWANDSFGHLRRLPNRQEQQRPGGHGLYYHSSYWSNYTTSYLATSSTPLALMKSELRRAWDGGIRQLWIDNIGGLKPLELEMEFFLRSAWEAGKETTTSDIPTFTARWVDAKFSGNHGHNAGEIYAEYYQLNNQRKLEHFTADVFPQVGYGDEASRRLDALHGLYGRTNTILAALPADEKDAFFELFAIKIHLAYLTSAEFYYADRSTLAAQQGKAAAADHYIAVSRAFARSTRALIHHYNHQLAGGRWEGMFTPHAFPPPVMPMYPAGTPALTISGEPELGVTTWGSEPEAKTLRFSPHGPSTKWIEIFNAGAGSVRYDITADPWIHIDNTNSVVDTEQRVPVHIPNLPAHAGETGTITVTSTETGDTVDIHVTVDLIPAGGDGFDGVWEADGYVSIDPASPDRSAPGRTSRWVPVPHLGRYANAAMQLQPVHGHLAGIDDAVLEFAVYLSTPGSHALELHRLPTLDSTGRIRVAVSVDDGDLVVLESPTTDEHRGSWSAAIQDNVERLQLILPPLDAGAHRLQLRGVDDHVTLSKIVIYTETSLRTNLGPDFSAHTQHPRQGGTDPDPARLTPATIDADTRRLYGIDPFSVPLDPQAYADRHFWDGPTTFRIPHTELQTRQGATVDYTDSSGPKNVVATLTGGAVLEESGVIAFEAENALAGTPDAWMTPSRDDASLGWTHTQAETSSGTGLAMQVRPRGILWQDPSAAPGMHFAVKVNAPGTYRAWILLKFDDNHDDSCLLAIDGVIQPITEQFAGGEMCAYGLRQRWIWTHISDVELASGDHTLSVVARKSGLRVDRVYLTRGDELPPTDQEWAPSPRLDVPVESAA